MLTQIITQIYVTLERNDEPKQLLFGGFVFDKKIFIVDVKAVMKVLNILYFQHWAYSRTLFFAACNIYYLQFT